MNPLCNVMSSQCFMTSVIISTGKVHILKVEPRVHQHDRLQFHNIITVVASFQ